MAFFVNEDKPTSKAIIHRDGGPCEVPRPKLEQDGRWYGPFDSESEAIRVALDETNCRDVRECKVCKP